MGGSVSKFHSGINFDDQFIRALEKQPAKDAEFQTPSPPRRQNAGGVMFAVCEHAKNAPAKPVHGLGAEVKATMSETEYGQWLAEMRLRGANASTTTPATATSGTDAILSAVVAVDAAAAAPAAATAEPRTGLFNIWRIGPQERPPPLVVAPEPPKAKGVCPIDHSWFTGGKKAAKEEPTPTTATPTSPASPTTTTSARTTTPAAASEASPTTTTTTATETTTTTTTVCTPSASSEGLRQLSAQATKIDSQLKLDLHKQTTTCMDEKAALLKCLEGDELCDEQLKKYTECSTRPSTTTK